MTTDYQSVIDGLRDWIVAEHNDNNKRSFGQRELLFKLTELEAEHRVEEGLPEKALRLYGAEIHEAIQRSTSERVEGEPAVTGG